MDKIGTNEDSDSKAKVIVTGYNVLLHQIILKQEVPLNEDLDIKDIEKLQYWGNLDYIKNRKSYTKLLNIFLPSMSPNPTLISLH